MAVVLGRCSHTVCVLCVVGTFCVPLGPELRLRLRALLRSDVRRIALDLGRVSRIDAAGVGELVRAYNMTTAVGGSLRIVRAGAWVREILERVGLFDLLTADQGAERSSSVA